MKVESIVLGSIGTNCYIVTNEETKECFAVDMAECPQEYVNYIKNSNRYQHFTIVFLSLSAQALFNISISLTA